MGRHNESPVSLALIRGGAVFVRARMRSNGSNEIRSVCSTRRIVHCLSAVNMTVRWSSVRLSLLPDGRANDAVLKALAKAFAVPN